MADEDAQIGLLDRCSSDILAGLSITSNLPVRGFTFIVNPTSGGRRGQHAHPLADWLAGALPHAEVLLTRYPGDGEALARQRCMRSGHVVVAVGGDGTVHEVARGLVGGRALLGVVPVGSGNDFAKMLRSPSGPAAALAWFAENEPRACDVGQVRIEQADGSINEAHFINSLGIGFEAVVADRAAQARLLRGFARYLVAALRHLPGYQAPLMCLDFNGQRLHKRQFLVAIGNGRWAGGGFKLAPNARIDDGLFDLTRADDLSLLRLLTILPRVFSGGHLACSGVSTDQVQRVSIDCPEGCMVHGDGEIIARRAVRIEVGVLPGALRVLG